MATEPKRVFSLGLTPPATLAQATVEQLSLIEQRTSLKIEQHAVRAAELLALAATPGLDEVEVAAIQGVVARIREERDSAFDRLAAIAAERARKGGA